MEGGQKCFYFNHMNKATKNHIIVNGKGSASSGVRDVNMLLSAVHSEFEGRCGKSMSLELCVRSPLH